MPPANYETHRMVVPQRDVSDALLLWLIITYMIVNRAVVAIVTIPGPASIHPSMLILGLLSLATPIALMLGRPSLPRGVPAFWGLALFAILAWLPYLRRSSLGEFEARQFDQGLVTLLGLTALFIATHHVARHWRARNAILLVTVVLSTLQGLLALVETATRQPYDGLNRLWLSIGLVLDQRGIQDFSTQLQTRLTGEIRPSSTAPHAIILSAILAVSAFLAMELSLNRRGRARAGYALCAAACGVAFATNNSRTGYLVAAVLTLIWLYWHYTDALLMRRVAIGTLAAIGTIGLFSPATLRFALNLATLRQGDNTAEVRFERIPLILDYLERRPFLGAGYFTHSVLAGQLWDNGYLHALTEFGMLPVGMMLAFFVAALTALWRQTLAPKNALVGRIGVLAIIALLVSATSVDAFTFAQFLPMVLILMAVALAGLQDPQEGKENR